MAPILSNEKCSPQTCADIFALVSVFLGGGVCFVVARLHPRVYIVLTSQIFLLALIRSREFVGM